MGRCTCSAVPIGQSNVELHVYVCYLRENVVYTKSKMCFVNTDAPAGHKIQKSGSHFFRDFGSHTLHAVQYM